jgi:hypothetical protein
MNDRYKHQPHKIDKTEVCVYVCVCVCNVYKEAQRSSPGSSTKYSP